MSDLVEGYVTDYDDLVRSINRTLDNLDAASGEEKPEKLRAVDKELKDAEDTIKQMKTELRSMSLDDKKKYTQRMRDMETELQNLRRKMQKHRMLEDRDQLLGPGAIRTEARQRLVDSNADLQQSSNLLSDSLATAYQTVEVGLGTTDNLNNQTESLIRSQKNVRVTSSLTGQAGHILTRMTRRNVMNKIIMAVLILLLLVIIGVIVYFAFFNKK